jgi:hypothetical protein
MYDWMHACLINEVASWEIHFLLEMLRARVNLKYDQLAMYVSCWRLPCNPEAHGSRLPNIFSERREGASTSTSTSTSGNLSFVHVSKYNRPIWPA